MAQRNVKLDEFELLKEDIRKRDLEILGLISEQIKVFAELIHAQNEVNRCYKDILSGLEERLRKVEGDFIKFRQDDNLDS